jgi:phosphohistidine phosphatase
VKLYLVQHAEAKPEAEDSERHLTDSGTAALCRVAGYASQYANLKIGQILHSGKTRARQTASILGSYLNPPEGVAQTDGLNPNDDPAIWAKRLASQADDLMLVGHLPNLSRLASLLLCGDANVKLIEFQMGGIVCLKRDADSHWAVGWMLAPEVV